MSKTTFNKYTKKIFSEKVEKPAVINKRRAEVGSLSYSYSYSYSYYFCFRQSVIYITTYLWQLSLQQF